MLVALGAPWGSHGGSLGAPELQKSLTTFDPGTEAIEESYHLYQSARDEVYGEEKRPVTLMDIALMGMKHLRKSGELSNLEVSREINAASTGFGHHFY